MKDLTNESSPLDPKAREVLYENLWDLYETREEKARNSRLTIAERAFRILQAGMGIILICKSCGRRTDVLLDPETMENLERFEKRVQNEKCWKCMCVGSRQVYGDPDQPDWD